MTVEPTEPPQPGIASNGLDPPFAEFIRRLRRGDERAATELMAMDGRAMRRAVRVWRRDLGLLRPIESVDMARITRQLGLDEAPDG